MNSYYITVIAQDIHLKPKADCRDDTKHGSPKAHARKKKVRRTR